MGYDSRVFLVKHNTYPNEGNTTAYNEIIMEIELCKMGPAFRNLFTEPLTGILYTNETEITEDAYGGPLSCADLKTMKDWVNSIVEPDMLNYRRFKLFKTILNALVEEDWTPKSDSFTGTSNLILVHYGS